MPTPAPIQYRPSTGSTNSRSHAKKAQINAVIAASHKRPIKAIMVSRKRAMIKHNKKIPKIKFAIIIKLLRLDTISRRIFLTLEIFHCSYSFWCSSS